MKNYLLKSPFPLVGLAVLSDGAHAQTVPAANTQTKKKADKWFESCAWANGLKLNVVESMGNVKSTEQYATNQTAWDKAFAYFSDINLDQLTPGKYPVDGENVFASVTENPAKELAKTQRESHRKYLDMQCVVQDTEKIGVAPITKATAVNICDETRGVINSEVEGKRYEAKPSTINIFFTQNVHRPNIKVDGVEKDKKLVITVKMA